MLGKTLPLSEQNVPIQIMRALGEVICKNLPSSPVTSVAKSLMFAECFCMAPDLAMLSQQISQLFADLFKRGGEGSEMLGNMPRITQPGTMGPSRLQSLSGHLRRKGIGDRESLMLEGIRDFPNACCLRHWQWIGVSRSGRIISPYSQVMVSLLLNCQMLGHRWIAIFFFDMPELDQVFLLSQGGPASDEAFQAALSS
jgi:hypothetical protein